MPRMLAPTPILRSFDEAATRAFYERVGYSLVATIPEYWAAGDDKVIFRQLL